MRNVQIIDKIKQEHKMILDDLDLLLSIPSRVNINVLEATVSKLAEIYDFWNEHEKKEENFFKRLGPNFPIKKMDIDHKEIRGHFKVLLLSLETKNPDEVRIAIETDGKMFADKLKRHMSEEEVLLDKELDKEIVAN